MSGPNYRMPEGPLPVDPEEFGGIWGEHPVHTPEEWGYEVSNGDTRRGYWEWVAEQVDAALAVVGAESSEDQEAGGDQDDETIR